MPPHSRPPFRHQPLRIAAASALRTPGFRFILRARRATAARLFGFTASFRAFRGRVLVYSGLFAHFIRINICSTTRAPFSALHRICSGIRISPATRIRSITFRHCRIAPGISARIQAIIAVWHQPLLLLICTAAHLFCFRRQAFGCRRWRSFAFIAAFVTAFQAISRFIQITASAGPSRPIQPLICFAARLFAGINYSGPFCPLQAFICVSFIHITPACRRPPPHLQVLLPALFGFPAFQALIN